MNFGDLSTPSIGPRRVGGKMWTSPWKSSKRGESRERYSSKRFPEERSQIHRLELGSRQRLLEIQQIQMDLMKELVYENSRG
jgi:hypothetical protein